MDLSILAARILALTYLAAGIAALSGRLTFSKIADDFDRSPGLTFVSGFLTLVLGMVLVTYHNRWVQDWTVLITAVGWFSLIKGVVLIAYPAYIAPFRKWYKNTPAWGLVLTALGALFGYLGFFR